MLHTFSAAVHACLLCAQYDQPWLNRLECAALSINVLTLTSGMGLFTNEEAVAFVAERLSAGDSAQQAAEQIVTAAIHTRGSRDNVTAVLTVF